MKEVVKKVYNKIDGSKFKAIILFCISIFFILLRNFLEIKNSIWYLDSFFAPKTFFTTSIFLFFHWIIWYIMVYFIVFACYRYIVKMPVKKIIYFSLSTFVLVIPVIVSILTGEKMNLAYLNIHDMAGSMKSLFSLFILDKRNFAIFFEMILLFVGCPYFSYKYSRSWKKAILNTIAIFIFIAIFGSFLYICPGPSCLFIIPSNFITAFFPFYWVPLSFISFLIFLLPEFKEYINNREHVDKEYIFLGISIYFLLFIFLLNITRYFFDILFVSVTYFIFYFILLFILLNKKKKEYHDVISFLSIYDLILFLLIISLIISKLF